VIDLYDVPPENYKKKSAGKSDKKQEITNPDCMKCRHFRITWDSSMPYSCQAFGFKCRETPCLQVLRTSGEVCRAFSAKS
jgi:hypothetical protein